MSKEAGPEGNSWQLDELQQEVDAWISQFKEGYFPPLANLARLTEEAGELARELNHHFGPKRKKASEPPGSIAGELGDLLFVLACIANDLDISLDEAFSSTMSKYRERDADRWQRAGDAEAGQAGDAVDPLVPDCAGERVSDGGEYGLFPLIWSHAAPTLGPQVVVGPGDDAAVIKPPEGLLVASCDLLVEGRDFRRQWITPAQLAQRALAVNWSDLASMGASPGEVLVTLGLTAEEPLATIEALYQGLQRSCMQAGCSLVGGDISGIAEGLLIDILALGSLKPGWQPLRRQGFSAGQKLYVTGHLGGSLAGLRCLEERGPSPTPAFRQQPLAASDLGFDGSLANSVDQLLCRHLTPQPRLAEGQFLASWAAGDRNGLAAPRQVPAVTDISDGLARETTAIAGQQVGIRLNLDALPVDAATREVAQVLGEDPLEVALLGGEDFELLLGLDPADGERLTRSFAAQNLVQLTCIGEVTTRHPGRVYVSRCGDGYWLDAEGYDHLHGSN